MWRHCQFDGRYKSIFDLQAGFWVDDEPTLYYAARIAATGKWGVFEDAIDEEKFVYDSAQAAIAAFKMRDP